MKILKFVGIWITCFLMITGFLTLAAFAVIHAFIMFGCFVEWSMAPFHGFWAIDSMPQVARFIIGVFSVVGVVGATQIVRDEYR